MKHLSSIPLSIRVLAGLFILTALAVLPIQASPGILYVAPGGNCGGAAPCYGDIQSAVLAAVKGDEVRIAKGTYSQTSKYSGVTSVVRIYDKKITVRGGYTTSDWNTSKPAANPTIIDAKNNGVGFYVRYQADTGIGEVIIDGLSITGGNATDAGAGTDSGGGIFIKSTTHVKVTIQNCKIYENASEDGNGAGIWGFNTDNLAILNCEIHDNQGGGIGVSSGNNPSLVDSVVTNNEGPGMGIYTDMGGRTNIHNNEITSNQGSGIVLNSVTGGSVTDNLIEDNHEKYGGGGMDISGATHDFQISGNTVRGNSSMQGGGIDISGSVAKITNNHVESNFTSSSSNGGGGLYVHAGAEGAYVLVSGNTVISNTTGSSGGGIMALGFVDIVGNTVTDNSSWEGGGISAGSDVKIVDNLVANNRARMGGGISAHNAQRFIVDRNRVMGNTATDGEGGGIRLTGSWYFDVSLDGNQVISNTASKEGGGIYLECPATEDVDPVDISNTVLADNVAPTGSGLLSSMCETRIAYSSVSSNRGTGGDGVGFYLEDPMSGTATHTLENTIIVSQTIGVYVKDGSADMEATFWGSGDWANDAKTGGPGAVEPGTKNYEGDPGFVDPAGDDYHITEDAVVIDKGIDTWATNDMDAQSRPKGETDIGADEYLQTSMVFLPMVEK